MYTILAMDDSTTDLKVIQYLLRDTYEVLLAVTGKIALRYLQKRQPDLILLDLMMPDIDGKEMISLIRKMPQYVDTPVIFLTADRQKSTEVECLRMGAFDFIPKPIVPEVLRSRISKALELNSFRKHLQKKLDEKTWELEQLTLQSIHAIADIIDAKDSYTKGHSVRVADCSRWIAEELGWKEDEISSLHQTALLHDVGKVGVPDKILLKNDFLTADEMEVMRNHTVIGYNILRDISGLKDIELGARYHHEWYDGNGYPDGLKGEQIPLIARIICLADAFDAMSSNRCYRHSLSSENIKQEILRCRGTQFDPDIVDAFMKRWEELDFEEYKVSG